MIHDWVLPASLTVVTFVMLMVGDRAKWLLVDAITSMLTGAMFVLAPAAMMRVYVKGDIDDATLLMTQMNGMVMIGGALVWIFTRETRDGTVAITLMMARVFASSLTIMVQAYTYWGTKQAKETVSWNENMITIGMYGYVLIMLANLYYLTYSDDFSTYPQHNIRINTHLRLDAGLSLLQAVLFLALPDFVVGFLSVKSASRPLLHMCRCVGINLFTSVIISLQAPGFLHEKDKRAQFSGRLVSHLLQLCPLVLMVLWFNTITMETFGRIFLVFSPILINAAFGVFADGTIIYRVPKSKLN